MTGVTPDRLAAIIQANAAQRNINVDVSAMPDDLLNGAARSARTEFSKPPQGRGRQ